MSNPIYFVSGLIGPTGSTGPTGSIGPAGSKFIKRTILQNPNVNPYQFIVDLETKLIFVQAYGGGGAGGGADAPTINSYSVGSGGGAGGYVELWLSVTGGQQFGCEIGQGGVGNTNTYAETGGDTIFGTYITSYGGIGGASFKQLSLTNTSGYVDSGIGGGGQINGADPNLDSGLIIKGGSGVEGMYTYNSGLQVLSVTSGMGGLAAKSSAKNIRIIGKFNIGAIPSEDSSSINLNAEGFGCGGAGAYAICNNNSNPKQDAGGNGANGAIIITEYS
jgi:hypothetical protein